MMINVRLSKTFRKRYKKRITTNYLKLRFRKRLILFTKNPQAKILADHRLGGKLTHNRAFSITDDLRVIYRQDKKNTVTFIDIGTHHQVYSHDL